MNMNLQTGDKLEYDISLPNTLEYHHYNCEILDYIDNFKIYESDFNIIRDYERVSKSRIFNKSLEDIFVYKILYDKNYNLDVFITYFTAFNGKRYYTYLLPSQIILYNITPDMKYRRLNNLKAFDI